MLIYSPKPRKKLIGGPYSFLRNLQHVFSEKKTLGFSFTNSHLKADALFFPVTFSHAWIRYYKRLGLPVIQRLDGLNYPEKHGNDYVKKNKPLEGIYKNLATHIIFQSKHSKNQFEAVLGESAAQQLSIITNGARTDLFCPNEKHTFNEKHIKFITTGNFRGEDMLEPLLKALDFLEEKYTFTLTIIGNLNVSDTVKHDVLAKPYVKYEGPQNLQGIAENLKTHDIFLFSQLNPPCPNSVIEALCCGLPVVSFDSGAMEEICSTQLDLLAPTEKKGTFNTLADLDAHALAASIENCIEHYSIHRSSALAHANQHSMEACALHYAKAFLEVEKSLKHVPMWRKRLCYAWAVCDYAVETFGKALKRLFVRL